MVAEQLTAVRRRVAAAAIRSGRSPEEVELIAISKGHTLDKIMEAYRSGHRVFGENRSDELVEKAAALPDDIHWHYVGQLQSRKTADVAGVADVIHSVDRPKLLTRLAQFRDVHGHVPSAYLQVNIAGEAQKGGVTPHLVTELLTKAGELAIPVIGFMLIPPLSADPSQTRGWFGQLREIRDRHVGNFSSVTGLSMGMTDDFEMAIEEGATSIRVGRAIFGERRGGAAA